MLRFVAALPPCRVGLEACGTAHHWGRELTKLGHAVRLMPPAGACPRAGQWPDPWVKPYVKRGKTDAGDAAAIAEPVTRPVLGLDPGMRFVAVKTELFWEILILLIFVASGVMLAWMDRLTADRH